MIVVLNPLTNVDRPVGVLKMNFRIGAYAAGVVLAVGLSCGACMAQAISLPNVGKLPQKMQMHGTALIGNRMYVFGGDLAGGANSTLWSSNVQSALIDTSSAAIGEWRDEQPLPELRAYMTNCVEVVNDRIYIVGGVLATNPTSESNTRPVNTVTWTKVKPDGRLEPWRLSPPFPGEPLLLTATCSTDDSLVLIGGLSKEGKREVYAASFSADGEPTNWRQIGALPGPLYNHGACIQEDRIYVWGGMTAPRMPNARVFSAEFKDGKLGQWRDEQPMPDPTYGAAACGINDYLVSVAGRRAGSQPSSDIWFARIADGRVSGWAKMETNLEATVYHNMGLLKSNGWVFVTGGQNKKKPTADDGFIVGNVQAFKIPSAAAGGTAIAAGLPTVEQALQQAKSSGKKAMVFFYSPAVPACKRVWDNVISKPEFASMTANHVVGAVDTSQKDTTWSYKLGVFRVPCLVELNPDGTAARKSPGLTNAEDVQSFLTGS